MSRRLARRLAGVDAAAERWRRAAAESELDLSMLTPAELERAAAVRERLDAVGLSGISDADLEFRLCLHARLGGDREEPCPTGEP